MTKGPKERAREAYGIIKARTVRRLQYDRLRFMSDYAKGKTVLDIGCVEHSMDNATRSGWLHQHLVQVASEVVGLDYEEDQVKRMQELGFTAVAGDATNFDLGRIFDVVVAGETLEHLLNAEGFLKSVRKHMHPDSLLLLSVPNANSINYFSQNMIYGHEVDGYDHSAFYTPLTMYNLLRKCGFELDVIAFFQADTREHHTNLVDKILVGAFRYVQLIGAWFRPNLARQFVVVAKPAD